MYDTGATAVARFFWEKPGTAKFAIVPLTRLYAN
jgi:hypothetical protein